MITIGIPTCRRPALFERAVCSCVEGQGGVATEIVVVHDDPRFAHEYNAFFEKNQGLSIRRIVHERNRGPSAARNTILRAASGDWLLFLDDDDYLEPGALELMTKHAAIAPAGCGLVTFAARVIRLGEDAKVASPVETMSRYGAPFWAELGTLLFRRDALLDIAGFDENLRAAENRDLTIRLLAKHTAESVNEVVVNLDYGHTLPRGSLRTDTVDCNLAVLEKNRALFEREPLWSRSMHLFVACHAAAHGRLMLALWLYCRWALGARAWLDVRFLGSIQLSFVRWAWAQIRLDCS